MVDTLTWFLRLDVILAELFRLPKPDTEYNRCVCAGGKRSERAFGGWLSNRRLSLFSRQGGPASVWHRSTWTFQYVVRSGALHCCS